MVELIPVWIKRDILRCLFTAKDEADITRYTLVAMEFSNIEKEGRMARQKLVSTMSRWGNWSRCNIYGFPSAYSRLVRPVHSESTASCWTGHMRHMARMPRPPSTIISQMLPSHPIKSPCISNVLRISTKLICLRSLSYPMSNDANSYSQAPSVMELIYLTMLFNL